LILILMQKCIISKSIKYQVSSLCSFILNTLYIIHRIVAIIPSEKNQISIQAPETKKQKKMFIVLAFVAVAIILVLYFGFGSSDSPAENMAPQMNENMLMPQNAQGLAGSDISAKSAGAIMSFEKTVLDFGILTNPLFQVLRDFESLADIPGEKGRSNPFLPY